MKTSHVRFGAAAAAVVLILAACGDTGDDGAATTGPVTTSPVTTSPVTTSAPGSDVEALAGSSWVVRSMDDPFGAVTVTQGNEPTLEFGADGSSASGSTGCNLFSGDVTIGAGSIAFGPLAVTERACLDQGLMDTEARFIAVISSVSAFTLANGELSLSGDAGSMTLTPGVPVVDLPLEGTDWMLDTLSDGLAATSVLQTTRPEFGVENGTVSGTTGCNTFGGTIEFNGTALAFTDLFWTEIGCEPDVMDQEAFILDVLTEADRLEIEGERLTIFAGERFLSYRAG